MNYKIINLENKNEWNLLLNKLPVSQQDIYYTPEYYSLYEEYGDGEAQCFVFEKNEELALYPFLINSVNDLGYSLDDSYYDIQGAYGYNGVVSTTYASDFIRSFYKAFDSYCEEENIIAEFTRFHPLLENQKFSLDNMIIINDRKTVYVNLNIDYEEIFRNYQRTTRRQIRKNLREENLQVLSSIGSEYSYETFYRIYHENMVAINSEDYLFFNLEYFKNLLAIENVYVLYVIVDDKIISNISVLFSDNYMHGHLGGSINEVFEYSPFSLLYDKMIKFGVDNNKKYLHVGGGLTSSENDNLLKFKTHFSKDLAQFSIGKKVHNQPIYDEVIELYTSRNPEGAKQNKNMLLKYREL